MLGEICSALCGKTIHEIVVVSNHTADQKFKSRTKVPTSNKLFNFDLKALNDQGTWLILDGYGDEWLSETLVDRVLGKGTYARGYALAIDRKTGITYIARFNKDGRTNCIILEEVAPRVPKSFLRCLDELCYQKRPFCLSFPPHILIDLLDRELGYKDLLEELVVELRFKKGQVQIWGDAHRLVSDWM